MSDFAITRVDEIPDDKTWAASAHGFDTAGSGTLDVSAFTAGTHYPNGYIPSGTPVAKLGSGLFGPVTAAGEGAAATFDAIILEAVTVRDGQTKATFAALDHGIVHGDRLRGSVAGAVPAAGVLIGIR